MAELPKISRDDDDNEFINLPDDPEEAFAVLQRREFRHLEEIWENQNGGSGWYSERQYVDKLIAFDEVHDLGLLISYRNIPRADNEFSDFFQDFRRHAEVTAQKIRIEAARRLKTGAANIVVLDDATRPAIHKLIEAIREKLNDLQLSEQKREALFNKLNAFAAEIDRNRTRTESIYAFAVETSRVAKEIDENIKPFKDLKQTLDRLLDYLDKAKKWKDSLPPWSERKKLEAPPKQIENKSDRKGAFGRDLDDDIPF